MKNPLFNSLAWGLRLAQLFKEAIGLTHVGTQTRSHKSAIFFLKLSRQVDDRRKHVYP